MLENYETYYNNCEIKGIGTFFYTFFFWENDKNISILLLSLIKLNIVNIYDRIFVNVRKNILLEFVMDPTRPIEEILENFQLINKKLGLNGEIIQYKIYILYNIN